MKKTRLYFFAVLLLALSLVLVACGGAEPAPEPEPAPTEAPAEEEPAEEAPAEEEPAPTEAPAPTEEPAPTEAPAEEEPAEEAAAGAEVTLWHAYGTSSAEEAALATLIDNAQAEFPDLTINVLQLPFDQIFNRYSTEVATGGGPDMFVAPNDDLGNWARSGIVMPLDDQLAGKLGNVEQVAIDGMMVDGQLYGVPESAKAVALYYNKSMVDAAPATTDELLALVEGGTSIVLNQNAYHSFPFFTAFGGQLMDANGVCIADQTGFTEAAEYLLALKEAGASFETDGGRADTLFRSGEVAMIVNGPWTLGDYREDLGDDLGVAPVPAGSTPAAALNGIDGFYLNPNSANPDTALDLALFLTNPDSSAIYTSDAGHVPIRTDVTADDELVQGFAAASAQGFPRPQSEAFGNYWGPFGDMVTNVLEGVEEPAAAVAAACAAMNDANGKDAADAIIEAPAEAASEESGSGDEAMSDASGEVSLWHAYGTSSAEEAALATLVENAQAAFPNLTINVLQLPFDQIFNRYSTEVATGGGPDMFVAPNDDLGNWARSGIVMPLDDQLAGKLDNVEQVAIDGMMVDGQLYGVPESAKAVALYYNKALVDAPPTTTDELLALVEGGSSIVLNQNAYHSFPFFTAFGGQLMDANGVCIADQTGFTEAAEYLLALKEAGASFETDGGRADTLFRSGEVAMIVNGPWTLGDYREDLGEDLGVVSVPTGSTPAAALNGIDGFYLNPNSANQEAALDLALFLTNPESSAIYTSDAGHVPIRTDVTADDELVQGFAAASAQGFPRPQSEAFGNYWGPFGDMVTNVLEGVEEPAAAVEAACAAMNDANGKDAADAIIEESAAPAEEAADSGSEVMADVSGEVSLWHAYGTSSAEEAALATLVENAQAAFPNLTINVLQLPFDQIFNRYSTEVATGGGPDMFVAPNDDLGNWARSGIVMPLDEQLDGKLGNVEQVAIDGMMVDGQLYGVPESAKAVALYYNKALVDAPPATMDDLMALVEGGSSIVLNQNAYHSFPFFTAFGGQLMDDDGMCVADQTGFTEAAEYMLALKEAGASFETDGGRADTLFRSGEVAMIVNGPWTLGDYREDLGEELGVAPVPAGSAPAAALNGIDGFYLNPNSENQEAALELALFLTNPASSAIYTSDAGHVPIRTDVTADSELVQGFAAASAQGFPRPQSEEFGNYWGPFGDMVTNVLEGVEEPAAAVQAACAAMNDANGK